MGGNVLPACAATVRDAPAAPSLPGLSVAAIAIAGKLRPPPLPSTRPLGRSESPLPGPIAQPAQNAAQQRAQPSLASETPAVREAATSGDPAWQAQLAHAKAQAEAEERAQAVQLARARALAETEERAWQAQLARAKAQAEIEERTWQALLERAKARAEQSAGASAERVTAQPAADQTHMAARGESAVVENSSPAEHARVRVEQSAPREVGDLDAQDEEREWQALRARAQAAWELRDGGSASRPSCVTPPVESGSSSLPWHVVRHAAPVTAPAIVVWP